MKQARKNPRLQCYDYNQPGAYFVTICTKNRANVLGSLVGGDAHIAPQIRLSDYGRVVDHFLQSERQIQKYIIMPNHIHCIVLVEGAMWASPPTRSVKTVVRSFKTLVTKQLGTSLFQRTYHDHIIRGQADYDEVWTYIENNPIKWFLNHHV